MVHNTDVGLIPTRPQNALGMRIEPPWSAPIAMSHEPSATSAPQPELLPPEVLPGAYGLSTGPVTEVKDEADWHIDSVEAFPAIYNMSGK